MPLQKLSRQKCPAGFQSCWYCLFFWRLFHLSYHWTRKGYKWYKTLRKMQGRTATKYCRKYDSRWLYLQYASSYVHLQISGLSNWPYHGIVKTAKEQDRPFRYFSYQNDRYNLVEMGGIEQLLPFWEVFTIICCKKTLYWKVKKNA